jgi:hypothetical protein
LPSSLLGPPRGGNTWVWAQGLALDRQVLYYLNYDSSLFCFGHFWDMLLYFIQIMFS